MTDADVSRRQASQTRSRKTVENILASAAVLVAERGADPVTMTDIAQNAGVSIASIYQYFRSKSAIMQALLRRHNDGVDALVDTALDGTASLTNGIERVQNLYAEYARLHREDPFYRSIWAAVRADAELQNIDLEDSIANGDRIFHALRPFYRKVDETLLKATCALLVHATMSAAGLQIESSLGQYITPAYQHMIATALRGLEQDPAG